MCFSIIVAELEAPLAGRCSLTGNRREEIWPGPVLLSDIAVVVSFKVIQLPLVWIFELWLNGLTCQQVTLSQQLTDAVVTLV